MTFTPVTYDDALPHTPDELTGRTVVVTETRLMCAADVHGEPVTWADVVLRFSDGTHAVFGVDGDAGAACDPIFEQPWCSNCGDELYPVGDIAQPEGVAWRHVDAVEGAHCPAAVPCPAED